ncbi:MAG: polyamine ABC transporter substrate-binding protein [Candidatus Obscuribacterales bacterium]|nr:polyamine ABC transporter substrate-binding protein [Steroidobacteraceae bacterium]
MKTTLRFAVLWTTVVLLAACGKKEAATPTAAVPAGEEKVLNLYIWNDYLAEDTVANFEKDTGIKVSVSNYGSNEELDSKLAPGKSGYDIVVPSASTYERQIKSGYYQKLDKALLPNLKNMDPEIQTSLATQDANNDHAALHMWGTTGIGYNVKKVKAAMSNAPTDSWHLVFDPKVAKSFEKCGIAVLDSATEMFSMVLAYLGKDPNSQTAEDLNAAGEAMMKFRPYIRYMDTQRMITDLANGEICIAVGYNGDILQARDRAEENKTGQEIAYSIPKEGSIIWFDSYLIPADAPHPKNAHLFINYMLRPEVIAAVTNTVNYANGNTAATSLVDPAVSNDPGVYPPAAIKASLKPDLADTEETTRLMTRMWTRFMTGK